MFASLRFVTLCLFVSAACASSKRIPTLKKIPVRAVKLAHDTENHIFIAYDRNNEVIGHVEAKEHIPSLDKRILGTCSRLSADDIQKLPGWEKLRDYAVQNWGDGWDTLESNPEGFPDRAATVCVGAEVTEVTLETPTCSELSQDTFSGSTQGTNVTVELTAEQGTVSSHVITVVEQSKIGMEMSVGASISIPAIADISAKATFGVSFTNTLNKADTVTDESLQGQIITMYAEPNTKCTLNVDKRRCDVNGEGSQRLVARGWAWVNYGSPRQDHYKWAMNMEEILNEDERSSFIRFRTSSSTELKAEYKASCEHPLADMPPEVAAQFQRL